MGRVERSGYIILLIILIILYKYIYILYFTPFFSDHNMTKALLLHLQLQILSPLHSASVVAGKLLLMWSKCNDNMLVISIIYYIKNGA